MAINKFFSPKSQSGPQDKDILAALNQSMAVIHFDTQGKILWANKNFCQALGYQLDEIQGRHHAIFIDPDYAKSQNYKSFWARLRAGEFLSAEFKRLHKSGTEIHIQASYNPILDNKGQVAYVVKYATDITIPKTKEREALDRTQAVIHFDTQGNILEANKNFCKTMGYSLQEIVGKHHSMFVEPDYAASDEYKQFWADLRGGGYQSGEFKRYDQNGEVVWLRASYNPVYNQKGEAVSVTKYAADITHQKKVEQEVRDISFSVASATEQMSSSIHNIVQTMDNTQNLTKNANEICQSANSVLNELVTSADNMGKIIDLISKVNGQITLLSLNATIEAARAGDAGKGFAVVADEVKKLASDTEKSTDGISKEITAVQAWTAKVSETLKQIIDIVEQVNNSTLTATSATEEQPEAVHNISGKVHHLRELIT